MLNILSEKIMQKIELKSSKRDTVGKKVKSLREKGLIPAVLYGANSESVNLSLKNGEFEKVYAEAGSSALVDLFIDDKPAIKILIHEPQTDPVTDKPLHVDLYKVKMTEKITTEIPLEFTGESPAVKDLEGNLITNKDAVEVECLPGDLISEIKIDISGLKTFDDAIRVSDLNIPETVKILDDAEEIVAQVTPPRSEEELKEMEEVASADEEKEAIGKIEADAEAEKAAKEAEKTEAEGAPEGTGKKEDKSEAK
jgi:large subunit ribosomal protein L25